MEQPPSTADYPLFETAQSRALRRGADALAAAAAAIVTVTAPPPPPPPKKRSVVLEKEKTTPPPPAAVAAPSAAAPSAGMRGFPAARAAFNPRASLLSAPNNDAAPTAQAADAASSRYFGVRRHSDALEESWVCALQVDEFEMRIGTFRTEKRAAQVYDLSVIANGIERPLNFPQISRRITAGTRVKYTHIHTHHFLSSLRTIERRYCSFTPLSYLML